jgi:hypothetical protein
MDRGFGLVCYVLRLDYYVLVYNGHRPRNQQRQNDGHIGKILHLQRDKIQQSNQRQVDS